MEPNWLDLLNVCVCKNVQTLYHPQTNVQTDLLSVHTEDCVFQISKTVHTVDLAPFP